MEAANLAVIGAGPKAAAIAARVAAIHAWRAAHPKQARAVRPPPRIHIFERRGRAGAHWFGDDGYTDGMQEMCTPEDCDLVFPARSLLGNALDLAPFAWRTFRATLGGVPPSQTHRHLADYIAWALDRAINLAGGEIELHVKANVTKLRRNGAHWSIDAGRPVATQFDGVVVTSPGPAYRRFDVATDVEPRISNAQAYWLRHRADIHASIAAGQRVAVIGAGGAAAAICVDALATITDAMPEPGGIVLIAPQATLFTRGESRFETEVLTQADTWTALPREARRQVAEHLLSGVVFRRVLDRLEGLSYLPAFFIGRAIAAVGHAGHVGLWCITLDDRTTFIEADWVVDASGFDPLWFADLLEEPARAVVRRLSIPTLAEHLDDYLRLVIEARMLDDESLRLPLIGREPGLHVPFLAGGSRPPGRASLLQLGILADEILQPYLR
jgi:mycobactin lysine-N-oxygenase